MTLQGFVSFCGRDPAERALARQLLSRLNAQPLDVWIYERPGAFHPPPGQAVGRRILDKLDASAVVVILVTAAAFDSDNVRTEIAHVVDREADAATPWRALAVLATDDLRGRTWPPPFAALRAMDVRWLPAPDADADADVDADADADADVEGDAEQPDLEDVLETALAELCAVLGVPYLDPTPSDVRLPLRRRLVQEIGDRVTREPHRDAGHFDDLMRLAVAAEEAQCHDHATSALDGIDRILEAWAAQYQGDPPYYPRVARGAVLAASGRHDEAWEAFQELVDEAGQQLDENAHGGLGHLCLQSGRYADALSHYERARALCPVRDSAIAYNLLLCHLALDRSFDATALDSVTGADDEGLFVQAEGERARLQLLRAVALIHAGETGRAQRCLDELSLDGSVPWSLFHDLADALEAHTDRRHMPLLRVAVDVLGRHQGSTTHWERLHPLARLAFRVGDWRAAARHFTRLCKRYPQELQFQVERARSLQALGRRRAARRAARLALEREGPPVRPVFPEDLAYDRGFAHWLLDDADRARQLFDASHREEEQWYARVSPG